MSRWFVFCLLATTSLTSSTSSHRERRTIAVFARGLADYLGINQPASRLRGGDPVQPLEYPLPIIGSERTPRASKTTPTIAATLTTTETPEIAQFRAALRDVQASLKERSVTMPLKTTTERPEIDVMRAALREVHASINDRSVTTPLKTTTERPEIDMIRAVLRDVQASIRDRSATMSVSTTTEKSEIAMLRAAISGVRASQRERSATTPSRDREATSPFRDLDVTSLFRDRDVTSLYRDREVARPTREREITTPYREFDDATPFSTRFPPRRPSSSRYEPEVLPIASAADKKVVLLGIPISLHHLERLNLAPNHADDELQEAEIQREKEEAEDEAQKLKMSQNLYKAFNSLVRQSQTRPVAKVAKKVTAKKEIAKKEEDDQDMTVEEMMKTMQGYENNYEEYRARIAAKLSTSRRPTSRPLDSYGDVIPIVRKQAAKQQEADMSVEDMMKTMQGLEDNYEQYRARIAAKVRMTQKQTGRPIDSYGNIVPLVKPSKKAPLKKAVETPKKETRKQSALSEMFFGNQEATATTTTTTTPKPRKSTKTQQPRPPSIAHDDPSTYTKYLDSHIGANDRDPYLNPPPNEPDFFATPPQDAPTRTSFYDTAPHQMKDNDVFGIHHDQYIANLMAAQNEPYPGQPPTPGIIHDYNTHFGNRPNFQPSGPHGGANKGFFKTFYNRDVDAPKSAADHVANRTAGFGVDYGGVGQASPVQLAAVGSPLIGHRGEGGVRQGVVPPVYDFASSGVSVARAKAPARAPGRGEDGWRSRRNRV